MVNPFKSLQGLTAGWSNSTVLSEAGSCQFLTMLTQLFWHKQAYRHAVDRSCSFSIVVPFMDGLKQTCLKYPDWSHDNCCYNNKTVWHSIHKYIYTHAKSNLKLNLWANSNEGNCCNIHHYKQDIIKYCLKAYTLVLQTNNNNSGMLNWQITVKLSHSITTCLGKDINRAIV